MNNVDLMRGLFAGIIFGVFLAALVFWPALQHERRKYKSLDKRTTGQQLRMNMEISIRDTEALRQSLKANSKPLDIDTTTIDDPATNPRAKDRRGRTIPTAEESRKARPATPPPAPPAPRYARGRPSDDTAPLPFGGFPGAVFAVVAATDPLTESDTPAPRCLDDTNHGLSGNFAATSPSYDSSPSYDTGNCGGGGGSFGGD